MMNSEKMNSTERAGDMAIGEEERIRHDALFYSQYPDDGLLLSGERARSLFIKSKLPLPDLSKIWKLSDVTRDNMLDEGEFVVAMHLIQNRLCGLELPDSLSQNIRPKSRPLLVITQADEEEISAYNILFDYLRQPEEDFLGSEDVLRFLGVSALPLPVLAKIWDLADIDRDGKINKDEFSIAIHLTCFCKNSNSDLGGSIDVLSILPKKRAGESIQEKRRRRTEYQTDMRKLRSLKEKLESELINAESNGNEAAKSKIQYELDVTTREVNIMQQKEIKVREEICRMNNETTITTNFEVLRPFDRSFLMKKQSSGRDFLRQMKYIPGNHLSSLDIQTDTFIGSNIIEFARKLPPKQTKTRSRSFSKNLLDQSSDSIGSDTVSTYLTPRSDSFSSDDESDVIDVGRRRSRKKKHRPKTTPFIEGQTTGNFSRSDKSPKSSIGDEMPKQSNAKSNDVVEEKSAENTSEASVEDNEKSNKKDPQRKRSTSALQIFQRLFSSDSDGSSGRDGRSPEKRGLKKGISLEKSPWEKAERSHSHSSSSEDFGKQNRKNEGAKAPGKRKQNLVQVLSPGLTNEKLSPSYQDKANDTLSESVKKRISSESDDSLVDDNKARPFFKEGQQTQKSPERSNGKQNEPNERSKERNRGSVLKILSIGKINSPVDKKAELKTDPIKADTSNYITEDNVNNSVVETAVGVTQVEKLNEQPLSFEAFHSDDDFAASCEQASPVAVVHEDEISAEELSSDKSPPFDLIDILSETAVDSEEDENRPESCEDQVIEEQVRPSVARSDEACSKFEFVNEILESSCEPAETLNNEGKISVTIAREETEARENVFKEEEHSKQFNKKQLSNQDGLLNLSKHEMQRKQQFLADISTNDSGNVESDQSDLKDAIDMDDNNNTAPLSIKVYDVEIEGDRSLTNSNKATKMDVLNPEILDRNISSDDHSDADLNNEVSNEVGNEETDQTKVKKKKKFLTTKKGHVVRSRSFGLRNRSDPNRLSYVEECEWLDGLVKVELETIEKRKQLGYVPSTTSAKTKPKIIAADFDRSEMIDEGSLNLVDSRALVKSLLDMEMEGRRNAGTDVELNEKTKKRKRDKEFLARRRSMPLGKDSVETAEIMEILDIARIKRKQRESDDANDLPDRVSSEQKDFERGNYENDNNNKDSVDEIGKTTSRKNSEDSVVGSMAKDASAKHVIAVNSMDLECKASLGQEAPSETCLDSSRPLKNIKKIKDLYERADAKRSVDAYTSSSTEMKQHLARSKSLGEGLTMRNQSSNITMLERNPCSRVSGIETENNTAVCQDGSVNQGKRPSVTKNFDTITNQKETGLNDKTETPFNHEEREETAKDRINLRKVEDFKQLFEPALANDCNNSPSRKVLQSPSKEATFVESNVIRNTEERRKSKKEDDFDKDDIRGQKKQINHKHAEKIPHKERSIDTKGGEEHLSAKKNQELKSTSYMEEVNDLPKKVSDVIENKTISAQDKEEDAIPSIQDRLALFQTKSVGSVSSPTKKIVVRKERPKSFHGKTFNDYGLDDDIESTGPNLKLTSAINERSINKLSEKKDFKTETDNSCSSLGEAMLVGEPGFASNGRSREDRMMKRPTKSLEDASGTNVSNLSADNTNGVEKLNDTSYKMMVKDERIRRELAEQEQRDLEIKRQREAINTERTNEIGDKNHVVTQPSLTESVKPFENRTYSTRSPTDYRSFAQNEQIRQEIEEPDKKENKVKKQALPRDSHVLGKSKDIVTVGEKPDSKPEITNFTSNDDTDSPLCYRSMVKNERVRRELEEQERRENELKARTMSLDHTPNTPSKSTPNIEQKPVPKSNTRNDGAERIHFEDRSAPFKPDSPTKHRSLVHHEWIKKRNTEKEEKDDDTKPQNVPNGATKSAHYGKATSVDEKAELKTTSSREGHGTQLTRSKSEGNQSSVKNEKRGGSLKTRKIPSRIEQELEEERQREEELLNERRIREEEIKQVLEEEQRKKELIQMERKVIEEEEAARQNSIMEEKMKRQARTRGLRAMFETA